MPRLRHSRASAPGWRRFRHGRGFRYLDQHGEPLPAEDVARVRSLGIPPAWTEVWICPWPNGHLQATGVDAAGRVQYLYHPDWRAQRDAEKFDRVLALARRLPDVRRRIEERLDPSGLEQSQVLATAIRLLDLGAFRIGSDSYREAYGSYGLTTLQRKHVRCGRDGVRFAFVGKAGVPQSLMIGDPFACGMVTTLVRGRSSESPLLTYRAGRRRPVVTPQQVNEHLSDLFRAEVTAKDLRTWKATVTAAAALARTPLPRTRTEQRRVVKAAMVEASDLLGNTPTVARASYVDPRVVERFDEGQTIAAAVRRLPADPRQAEDRLDRAVLRLLAE